jgi:hypothetical protein
MCFGLPFGMGLDNKKIKKRIKFFCLFHRLVLGHNVKPQIRINRPGWCNEKILKKLLKYCEVVKVEWNVSEKIPPDLCTCRHLSIFFNGVTFLRVLRYTGYTLDSNVILKGGLDGFKGIVSWNKMEFCWFCCIAGRAGQSLSL